MKTKTMYPKTFGKSLFTVFVLLLSLGNAMAQETPQATYHETHRPQYHFSPAKGWMNDPNGMFYYEGEYHLFYQYYPDKTVWGPMHWGHAVSKDLAHWENLPIALYPDSLGYIFSGSAVVDWKNTSGFGINNQPPLVAIFTYHDMAGEKSGRKDYENQGIAYSNDKGRTWTKYVGNPVLKNNGTTDFRDPKVIWDEARKQWVMALAVQDHHEFWVSKDLKNWVNTGSFGKEWGNHGGVWECADLFPLKNGNTTKWILIVNINPGAPNGGSGTQYFVGNFDGKTFHLDEDFKPLVSNGNAAWLDYGRDNYAGVTWSDVPKSDGRRILIGWMNNWQYANLVPSLQWRGAATLPRELKLVATPQGYRVAVVPVKELQSLRNIKQVFSLKNQKVKTAIDLTPQLGFKSTLSEIEISFEKPQSKGILEIEIANNKGERYVIGYNTSTNTFFSDRTQSGKIQFSDKFANSVHTAPRLSNSNTIKLHVFFDVASAELFADGGTSVLTDTFFPNEDYTKIQLKTDGTTIAIKELKIWSLKSTWK
ncbi:glycoside hydrolase family 32 protein [Flectobacillus major]|uniref:glycoside hydrolase family 32 protein n=1 Tax=Flectobacillus major TaxID=103 RepID=UPI000427556F|nr:glycoside hydrolase family 32 protein [Flectobacillus major]